MAEDKYTRFKDLEATEKRGEDYDFEFRERYASGAVVIAPHGGTIEPLTDEIANAIAGDDFSFYCFKALKPASGLHITSHRFDEPQCEQLVAAHQYVVSIHGWGAKGARVCVGGRDNDLIVAIRKALVAKGIDLEDSVRGLRGTASNNIVNRGQSSRGVQLELTMDVRTNSVLVEKFIVAVRTALLDATAMMNKNVG